MMRPVRKSVSSTNVTPKPLPVRSCAVRVMRKTESTPVALPKVNSATPANWRHTSTPVTEERKFRGPLKKRPITELTSTPAAATAKGSANKRDAAANKSTSNRTPATPLVAGRTRRAIKPNPRYTGEDMVTPRILKSVTSGSKDDDNSMDDFFNEESSNDSDVYLDDLIGKAFNDSDKEFTEYSEVNLDNTQQKQPQQQQQQQQQQSNTSSSATTPATAPRKRGRPRREPLASPVDSNATTTTTPTTTTATTTTTSKNELLTRAMGLRQSTAQKRPAERTNADMPVTRKRFVFSADGNKLKTLSEYDNKTITRSSSSNTTTTTVPASGGKAAGTPINKTTSYRLKEILDEALGSDMEEMADEVKEQQEQQENIAVDAVERKKTSLVETKTNAKVVIKKTLPVLRTRTQVEQHGKNNLIKSAEMDTAKETNNNNSKNLNAKSMPTFTIVNINDIISKKGDVLISKATPGATTDAVNNNKAVTITKTTGTGAATTTTTGTATNGRHERLLKKPTITKGPTILNHQLANRQVNAKTQSAVKQAPRILNAIVSKKTQPVKPTTQNPDDSAESFTLSLDEDEETDNEINKTFGSIGADLSFTELEENSEEEQQRNSFSNSPLTRDKSASERRNEKTEEDGPKNRSADSRNSSLQTESVEITRQGNKIVKKITCLENWYVISRKATIPPAPVVRNQFDMPLIELANAATTLELPNDQWSSKVTLYELPAATLAKSVFTAYTGDLAEHKISEEDREKYQPSCVMFRRSAAVHKEKSRLPYDRAVIFKNKTFYTNIDGKNVRLIAAPNVVDSLDHVESILNIMDTLSLQCDLVETTGSI